MDPADGPFGAELEELVRQTCEEHHVPGAAVGVHVDGVDFVVTHGVTSTTDPLPVTESTLFFIGSTSKTVTATALMTLVEQGRIALEDRVQDLMDLPLPDPEVRNLVTVGHLLDHTAGWVGDVDLDLYGPDALAVASGQIASLAKQLTVPGEVMSYNNASFVIAGRLLEVLCGEPYDRAVRRLVLDPLGMRQTWTSPYDVAQRRLAVGHVVSDGVASVVSEWPIDRAIVPAGGLISSVADQLTYAKFHLHGGPVLGDDHRLAMQQQRVAVRSGVTGVGVSWLLDRVDSTELVEHGGNVSNLQVASFSLIPDAGAAVTTLANSVGGKVLGSEVRDHVLRALGAPVSPESSPWPLPSSSREDYLGRYDCGQWSLTIGVDEKGVLTLAQRLHDLEPPVPPEVRATFDLPPSPHVLVGDDVIAAAAAPGRPVADFIRDSAGDVVFLRHGLRLCRKTR